MAKEDNERQNSSQKAVSGLIQEPSTPKGRRASQRVPVTSVCLQFFPFVVDFSLYQYVYSVCVWMGGAGGR